MLEITRSSRTHVTMCGGPALHDWREQNRLKVPGHQFTRLFKQKKWDGTWAPGEWLRRDGDDVMFRCTRGLLPRVQAALAEPITLAVEDETRILAAFGGDAESFLIAHRLGASLRDYQQRAFTSVVTSGWGRIAFATNAGKGAVIALLAEYAETRGHEALICCDEVAVFDALYTEITKWRGAPPAVVRAGTREIPVPNVVLAMVPTLTQRLKSDDGEAWMEWLARQEMLLLDEADRALAPSWQAIIKAATGTLWRAGFSGSFPTDLYEDLQLDELMGPVLERLKNVDLIERGISARPTIELHAFDGEEALSRIPKKTWRPPEDEEQLSAPARRLIAYDAVVVANAERHQFIMSLIQPDTPTVVIVNRIEHGRSFAEQCVGAVFLSGDADERERVRVLDAFAADEIHVLVTTKILDRGTNRLGHAADLILASGEGSTAQLLQRIGRGLRRADGKEWLRVVDILDVVRDPQGHDVKRAGSFFDRAVRKRLAVYADEGFDVRIVRR